MRFAEVRHLAVPLSGLLGCFRFWECRSLGGWENLAAKDAKERKESARYAPNVVQWIDNNAEPPTQSIVHNVSCPRRMECGLVLWNARHFEIAFQKHGYGWLVRG